MGKTDTRRGRSLRDRTEKRDLILSNSGEDVASQVGFLDVCYFSRVFKKYVGLPPGEYASQITCFSIL